MEPRVQYVTTPDGVNLAFSVEGAGPPLIQLPTFIPLLHLQAYSQIPHQRRLSEYLTSRLTLIRYDQRGHGLSDRDPVDQSFEAHVGDLLPILDRLGIERAALTAQGYSGPVAIAFAARHPERVSGLILVNTVANMREAVAGSPRARAFGGLLRDDWDLYIDVASRLVAGWSENEAATMIAAHGRAANTPEGMRHLLSLVETWDVTDELPSVRAPTLVLEYAGSASSIFLGQWTRAAATRIPDAQLRKLDSAELVAPAVLQFATGEEVRPDAELPQAPAGTAIILFADIVDSTALTEQLGDEVFRARASRVDVAMRAAIAACSGTPVDGNVMGDGVMAVFGATRHAIDAAFRCRATADGTGLALHLGLHAGDVIRGDKNVYGGTVNIAARICALSAPGEILVSDVVRGMARSSAAVEFEDRGEQEMKGVGEPVRVYAVRRRE